MDNSISKPRHRKCDGVEIPLPKINFQQYLIAVFLDTCEYEKDLAGIEIFISENTDLVKKMTQNMSIIEELKEKKIFLPLWNDTKQHMVNQYFKQFTADRGIILSSNKKVVNAPLDQYYVNI